MFMNERIDISMTRVKKRQERILLVAYYEPQSVPSIVETVMLIQRLSSFPVSVLNLAEHRFDSGYLKIPRSIDLCYFDAVIIHNTVAYNVDNLRSLDEVLETKFSQFHGVKIVMKQDEHYRFREFVSYVKDAGIDNIFTLMPMTEVEKTYGRFLPSVRIAHMLTGYITPRMRNRRLHLGARPIDIGYRGSIMPLSFGRLCYQKRKIGDEVSRRLVGRGLRLDISSRWEDRIGGEAWFGFLESCKSVLGVESGTGLFDLDGTLDDKCKALEKKLGPDNGSDAYAEAYLTELNQFEGKVGYFAISPRHFEAISAGAVQILMPGNYSGRMLAGRHYFELAEDYSNLEEAVDLVLDPQRRQEMAVRAFEEVVGDRGNWIESLVEEIDATLQMGLQAKGRASKSMCASRASAKNALVLQAHNYGCDPRRDIWYPAGVPDGILVHQLGITDTGQEALFLHGPKGELIVNVPRVRWGESRLDSYVAQCGEDNAASAALRELYFIAQTLALSDEELFKIYGMPTSPSFSGRFRWVLQYMLDTAVTLIDSTTRMQGVHAVIAINFPSLVPALVLKALLGVPVIYEALEYWPEADPDQGSFAEVFWREFERRMVQFADYRGTVTPQLASWMTDVFGIPFYSVPNCIPLSLAPDRIGKSQHNTAKSGDEEVRFLFQGAFAPHRGLELLIRAWGKTNNRAVLILRGPDNPFKEEMISLARGLGLSDLRVCFPAAVPTDSLLQSAQSDGDVGLVPYTATGVNYTNCSPNKLGQYLSVGLPILANRTNFVAEVVGSSRCGLATDFSCERQLIESVEKFCDDEFRQHCSDNAYEYFKASFNWDVVSAPFYESTVHALSQADPSSLIFYEQPQKAGSAKLLPTECLSQEIQIENERPLGQQVGLLHRLWRHTPERLRIVLRPLARRVRRRM